MSIRIRNCLPTRHNWLAILLGTLSLLGLYAISRYDFLLFHCLAEAFSIIIAIAVFAIFWNTRQFLENGVYLVIGFGCLFAGILDVIYIFGYKGMLVFPGADANIAIQAKTAAQWFVSLSCVCAFPFLRRKINQNLALSVYSGLLVLALGSIFYWRVFPDCYLEGVGQTRFESIGLVISCSAYLGAIGLLIGNRREFDRRVLKFLGATLVVFFLEDLASAVATDINGFAKTLAHLCQVVALYFVYKAFVEVGLRKPYDLLFRRQQQAEETLRQSEARYRLVVETIPQLAWRLSPDGLEVDCNRRWYEYTGQTPAQVNAHGWLAAVHPDDLFRVLEHAFRAAATKEPYELEYRLRRASDASYRWHLSRTVPVLGEDGQVTCWIGSNTDVEELKQAQEILKQAHDEQLQRHRSELAHVARLSMMGEMAASLAHELNQPLHAVKNYAYGSICRLAKSSEKDEEITVALEQIGKEASRAAEIIRRVTAFVQKREPRFSAAVMNGLVEEAVLFSMAELGRRHAKIALELAENLPAVMGDAIQIEQVIMNLVRNGLEAMDELPDDNRLLNIKTMRQGENMIQVDVRDCGKGIGGADLEKVFEPFFTTKPEGMGMGLAISRSIIQTHRGRLWATANPVRGCTFHFTVPIGNKD